MLRKKCEGEKKRELKTAREQAQFASSANQANAHTVDRFSTGGRGATALLY